MEVWGFWFTEGTGCSWLNTVCVLVNRSMLISLSSPPRILWCGSWSVDLQECEGSLGKLGDGQRFLGSLPSILFMILGSIQPSLATLFSDLSPFQLPSRISGLELSCTFSFRTPHLSFIVFCCCSRPSCFVNEAKTFCFTTSDTLFQHPEFLVRMIFMFSHPLYLSFMNYFGLFYAYFILLQ